MRGSKENLRDAIQQIRLRIPTLLLFSFCLNLPILSAPIYMMQIYDRVLGSGRIETLIGLTLIAGVAALAMGALDIVRSQHLNRIARWFEEKLAPDVVAAGFRDAFESRGFGTQALRDLATVRSFLTGNGLHALLDSPWVPVFLVLIWMMHPLLGIVGLISAIVLFAIALLNEHISRKPLQEADRASVINMQKVNSAVRGAEAVEAMGMLPGFLGKWIERNNTILGLQLAAADRSATMVRISKFVRMLVQIVVLGVGAYLVLKSELSAGGKIAVSIVLGRALAPVEQSITAWRGLVAAHTGWDRLREALERKQDTRDSLPLPVPTGRISCEQVIYRHPGRGEPILNDVTFKIEPGEALGIIGPSAAGKSTLCRLLVGTARPVRGRAASTRCRATR